jgi:putative oxidoreductase
MKIVSIIARVLLGLLFFVFGLNGFLQFIKQPPPTGLALQFIGALVASREIAVIMLVQIIGGALLLSNRFVPLALTLLAPVVFNIVLFHAFMAPEGLPVAIVAAALWGFAFAGVRSAFKGLLQVKVQPDERSVRTHEHGVAKA